MSRRRPAEPIGALAKNNCLPMAYGRLRASRAPSFGLGTGVPEGAADGRSGSIRCRPVHRGRVDSPLRRVTYFVDEFVQDLPIEVRIEGYREDLRTLKSGHQRRARPMHVANSKRLTHEGAKTMAAAAVAKARAAGIAISVAIADSGGHLIVLERMDGGRFHTVHSSTTKAPW